jgi:hypothetical protein
METNEVQIDFLSDWAEILRNELAAMGYQLPTSADFDGTCLTYFNVARRIVRPAARSFYQSKEFICPTEHVPGLEVIKRAK